MNRQLIAFVAVLVLFSSPAGAELIYGTFDFYSCMGFDFSTQACTSDPCLFDVVLAQVSPPLSCEAIMTCHLLCSFDQRSIVAILPGTTLDDVQWAPADSSVYGCGDCVGWSGIYVIHTSDGVYAKFRFTDPLIFLHNVEYAVQTDGTRNLGGVPVENSTWGEIKALYR